MDLEFRKELYAKNVVLGIKLTRGNLKTQVYVACLQGD